MPRYSLRMLLILLAIGPPMVASIITLGIVLLQKRRDANFLESLYKVEVLLDARDFPDSPPMLSLPPSD